MNFPFKRLITVAVGMMILLPHQWCSSSKLIYNVRAALQLDLNRSSVFYFSSKDVYIIWDWVNGNLALMTQTCCFYLKHFSISQIYVCDYSWQNTARFNCAGHSPSLPRTKQYYFYHTSSNAMKYRFIIFLYDETYEICSHIWGKCPPQHLIFLILFTYYWLLLYWFDLLISFWKTLLLKKRVERVIVGDIGFLYRSFYVLCSGELATNISPFATLQFTWFHCLFQ